MNRLIKLITLTVLSSLSASALAAPQNAQDTFTANAYNNNDGSVNWANNWQDSEDTDATAGLLRVTGGELRLEGVNGPDPTVTRTVDLSAVVGTVLFSYDYRTSNNLENNDTFSVAVATSAAGPFTTLANYADDSSATESFDITGFASATTTIRFQIDLNFIGGTEFAFFDDVNIAYDEALPAPSIEKSFLPGLIQAQDSSTLTFTLTNPNSEGLTGASFSDAMPDSIWLDSLTIGGTCTGFTHIPGVANGDSVFTLAGGNIPAASSCTVELTVKSNVPGTHDNVTGGVSSNESVTGNASNTASLTVTSAPGATCTPGNLGNGAVIIAFETGIYSLDLSTGKATLLTTRAFNINGVSVNPAKYLVYYTDNASVNTNTSIFFYDLLNNTHGTLIADVTAAPINMTLGASGLGSAGAAYSNGSIYFGVENVDDTYRIVLADSGRSANYSTLIFNMAADHDFGDFVVNNGKLFDFDRGPQRFRRYDMTDWSNVELDIAAAYVTQGGAQRDDTTIWNIGSTIQVLDFNGVQQGGATNITTDGVTALGSAFDAGGCVVATSRIGNLIWNDEDADNLKDTGEVGVAGVTVDLHWDLNGDGVLDAADLSDVRQTVESAADGAYYFDNLTPGDYIVRVTDTANILNGGAGTPPPSTIPTPVGANQTAVSIGANQEVLNIDFGYRSFIVIQGGSVFADNGIGAGGIAHNGLVDGDEVGFEGILVEARDPNNGNALITSTLTNASGQYDLYIPNSFADSAIEIVVQSPAGHQSISENTGALPGLVNPSNRDDVIRFVPVAGTVYSDINFGDVLLNGFTPDNSGTVQSGQVLTYPHEFISGSAGDVYFETNTVATPSGLTWAHVIYIDADCNAELSSTEVAAGALSLGAANTTPVSAGEKICLINKVFAPSNAPFNAQYLVTITETYAYTGETPDDLVSSLEVNDLTILAVSGLVLNKTVENLTTVGPATTSNTALPGQRLRYIVNYTNNSSQSIADLVVRDTVPAFTGLDIAVNCPGVLPNNLSSCAVNVPSAINNIVGYQGPVEWSFTGTLAAGQQGSVSFDVLVE